MMGSFWLLYLPHVCARTFPELNDEELGVDEELDVLESARGGHYLDALTH